MRFIYVQNSKEESTDRWAFSTMHVYML
jgi:hypothetical protein